METNTASAFSKKLDRIVHAEEYDRPSWESLKNSYTIGEFLMTCCNGNAVLKTSINGLQFFAHNAGECSTAPETKWHINSKALISHTARSMGLNCREEVTGGTPPNKWRADVYLEVGERKIAIEIQHSPQTLRHYFKRQEAYEKSGIEAYWILYRERFGTLTKAMFRYRYDTDPEYKKRFDINHSGFQMLENIPAFWLEDALEPNIFCVANFSANPKKWLTAIAEKKFIYDDGKWFIAGEPLIKPAMVKKLN